MKIKVDFLRKMMPYSLSVRENRLERAIASSCSSILESSKNDLTHRIQSNTALINQVKLGFLFEKTLKVITYVIKIFNSRYSRFDQLLAYNTLSISLKNKHVELLNFSKIQNISIDLLYYKDSPHFPPYIKLGVFALQKFQYSLYQQELQQLAKDIKSKQFQTEEEHRKRFDTLPHMLQRQLIAHGEKRGLSKDQLRGNLDLIVHRDEAHHNTSILTLLKQDYHKKVTECDQAIHKKQEEFLQPPPMSPGACAIDPTRDRHVYRATAEDVCNQIPNKRFLGKPISVVMASVEYAGFVKEGGLAEAVEGLSKGLKEQHQDNKVSLVFPKFSHLRSEIIHALKDPVKLQTSGGIEYTVYSYEKDGVQCKFIDHPAFVLPEGYHSVYGPNEESQNERFAAFSVIAADYISNHLTPDIVHVHDWHVAGIGIELKKQEALNKDTKKHQKTDRPAVVFTFHNNARMAQGRIGGGSYNYQGLSSAYMKWGIVKDNINLFAQMIHDADFVTTVSETFAEEAQDTQGDAQGVAAIVRNAARIGKLAGILNGANPHSWNPETDPVLRTWKDIESQAPMDLTYGPEHEDVVAKKALSKEQLQKWVAKYQPDLKIDFSKPIVTFIGRFDSFQKGLDALEEAIESTLKNGGQFICMGSGDHPQAVGKDIQDPKAKEILDRLQQKYKQGVFWVRDYREKEGPNKGKFHYQQGTAERPGIGPLIRAASDYVFVPSNFEPCGLVQFEGWLFGSLAIGSNVGGLVDSIIPQEKNAEAFNGFLFSREHERGNSCADTIKKAIRFWQQQDTQTKNQLIKRLIVRGRKAGWATRAHADTHSPVEKYRYAYRMAMNRARTHNSLKNNLRVEEALKRLKVLPNKPISSYARLEELYMSNYAHAAVTGISSEELEKLYLQLPSGVRHQFPSPYGINVHHTKHLEYGAQYTPQHTTFAVHAPQAQSIELVLFDEEEKVIQTHPMRKEGENWKLQVGDLRPGQRYQYKVNGKVKIDPYARQNLPSKDRTKPPYSVVSHSQHAWLDHAWMQQRQDNKAHNKGMSIYEIHPTTWKKKDGGYMNYRELAHDLVEHMKKGGYTHVELMGLLEHPDERSWGYQVSNFFAPNSRLGSVDDLKYMIDYLHQNNIGVILDWVPGHFAVDDYALTQFDGSNMFEPEWSLRHKLSIRNIFQNFGAKHFDYGKQAVREFLISNAHFWLEEMHIDGLRVDCVTGMLYSDQPKKSELFLKDLNAIVHQKHPGVVTVAEDYSGHHSLLKRFHAEGLGFDFKWNVGWSYHMWDYMTTPLSSRPLAYDQLKALLSQSDGFQQMPYISHDELKKAVGRLQQIPQASQQERIAHWKAMIGLLMTSQGHKLMFSGVELANDMYWDQWVGTSNGLMNHHHTLNQTQQEVLAMTAALNRLYLKEPILHSNEPKEIHWIEDPAKQVHAYRIEMNNKSTAVLHNFTQNDVQTFTITIPQKYQITSSEEVKKAQLELNLKRIEQKTRFVALIYFLERLLHFIIGRERNWVRIYIGQGNKLTPILLKAKTVGEITLLSKQEVFTRPAKELSQLLSTPRENQKFEPIEIFNSDDKAFGGQDRRHPQIKIAKESPEGVTYEVQVPALTTIVIKEK